MSNNGFVKVPVNITIWKREGESDEDARKRLKGLLESELENLADHSISCAVGGHVAVITSYSFAAPYIVLLESEEEAVRFLRETYLNEVASDQANGFTIESEINDEGTFATIRSFGRGGRLGEEPDITTWEISSEIAL